MPKQKLIGMPTLADCQLCDDNMVSKFICYLPNSQYYGVDRRRVAKVLDRNTRRRYLITLILFNDKMRANFESINE